MIILFLKAEQLGLFDMPTYVHGYTRKDGVSVDPHIAPRKRRLAVASRQPSKAAPDSPLDQFIARHGGPDHLRTSVMEMAPDQRAKLIDAMAHLGGIDHAAVIAKLGLIEPAVAADRSEPEKIDAEKFFSTVDMGARQKPNVTDDQLDAIGSLADSDKHTISEVPLDSLVATQKTVNPDFREAAKYRRQPGSELPSVYRINGRNVVDDGHHRLAAAIERGDKTAPVRLYDVDAEIAGAAKIDDDGPAAGEAKVVDGVRYVFRDSRWHRAEEDVTAAPAANSEPPPPAEATPDQEVEDAEDRQDLADAMIRNPHGEEAKSILRKIVARQAPAAETPGDDLDPSSPNYRYRDTGHVPGSRKELAATMIRRMARSKERVSATDIDWASLESNSREAKDLIAKENLFGAVDWSALAAAGMEPGAGFLISKVYASVGARPAVDSADGRRDYAVALDTLRDRAQACSTVDQVAGLLDEMRAERDGEMLNEQESALYQKVMAIAHAEFAKVRALDDQLREMQQRWHAVGAQVAAIEDKIRYGKGKKAPPPDAQKQLADLQAEHKQLGEEWLAFQADNGMKAITHQTKTAMGISSRFEYPYRTDYQKAAAAASQVRDIARARNAAENPLTRGWNSLGSGFAAILNYRSSKGSEAFARHVATAKAGRVKDWEWADKSQEPRTATKRSTTFQLQVADHFERRGGRSIKVNSTESLKEAFGLRDIQSGNWVLDDPNSAKFHVESCGGAFADLADIIGVSDTDVSFHGRLAMAFGARGHGFTSGKAHYEPVQRVINITKMAGGGSLAHEWFHMVDNLIKEAVTGIPADQHDFATENHRIVDDPEIQMAFRNLSESMLGGSRRRSETLIYTDSDERLARANMRTVYGNVRGAIGRAPNAQAAADEVERMYESGAFGAKEKRKSKATMESWRKIALIHHAANAERRIEYKTGPGVSGFLIDAIELDKGDSAKYWSSPHEMAARAFSAYIEDKLAGLQRVNTYLVSMANNAAYRAQGLPWRPYPEEDDRARINAAFDRIFELIRSRDVLAKAAESAWAASPAS